MSAVPREIHATLDSTNAEARRRIGDGRAHDVWIMAREQSGGRGRRGRSWVSDPGNLYVTRLVKPDCPPSQAAELSFVAALAARDAIKALLPQAAVSCKWPNDVLIDRRKVAGLLLETEGTSGWIAVGIGINVQLYPDGVEFPATAIKNHGSRATVDDVLAALADAFEVWLDRWQRSGFPVIREAWRAGASGLGETIRVRLDGRELTGIFQDIDAQGALILNMGSGRQERIAAGDVFF